MKNKFKDIAKCVIRTEITMSATDNDNNYKTTHAGVRLTGRVKWFNNKTGFGFITALTDSESVKEGSDVFVHHSAIKVAQEQYRYLVQGEYIDFVLSKLTASGAADTASKHEFQAVDVSGVKGGKLICETRWESRSAAGSSGTGFSGAGGASRFNRSNPNEGSGPGSEWKTVSHQKSDFVPRQGSSGEWRSGGRGNVIGGRGSSSA